MIEDDENSLICDFLETYHILDYRSLPVKLVATLAAGLRDNSRISMNTTEAKASTTNTILAIIADRLGAIISILSRQKVPLPSIFDALYKLEPKKTNNVVSFSSGEDFDAMWKKINEEK